MENVVGIADERTLVKGEEDRDSDEKIVEAFLCESDDDSRDSEGDEIFVEATEQLQDPPLKSDSFIAGILESENEDTILNPVDDENFGALNETETDTFEMAIGVPENTNGSIEEDRTSSSVEDKVVGVEKVDDLLVVAELAEVELEKDESNDSLEDIKSNGEVENSNIGEEIVHEISEEDDEKTELQDDKGHDLKDVSVLDTQCQNGENGTLKLSSNGKPLENKDDENDDHEDDEKLEAETVHIGNGSSEEKESNGSLAIDVPLEEYTSEELKDAPIPLVSENQVSQTEEAMESELEDEIKVLKSPKFENDVDLDEEDKDDYSNSYSEVEVDYQSEGDLKPSSISIESEDQSQICELNKTITDLFDSVDDAKKSSEIENPPIEKILENSTVSVTEDFKNFVHKSTEKNLVDEVHINNVVSDSLDDAEKSSEIENSPNEKVLENSSVSIPEDLKDFDHKSTEKNLVDEIEVSEKSISNNNEEKKAVNENLEKQVQPQPEVVSKSVNPAPSQARPAGLGRAAPLLEPAPRAAQQPRANGTVSQIQAQIVEENEPEETDETREKLQMIRVKFLRLAHRLGQTPHNVVVAQVLYRLGLAEQLRGRNGGRVGGFSFDRASAMAEQLEAAGQEPLDFSCTIMVLGKTGVGKSATINSIFDENKFKTDAFQLGTNKVQDVVGTVQGIKVRVIDTPGLYSSWSDQRHNEKILLSVKKFMKKNPPDIILYLDRLDMQSRDLGDMPLLRTITNVFGPSIWFNAIVVLTHAASAPPDGPNGIASSYDMFVTQRSHVVQQAIRGAAGDTRLMNPVSLVENHSACRTNRAGQRVLPNGQVWKPHLLLLSFASKILAEANTLLKLQDSPVGNQFGTRSRTPPLPFLLSSLLQSRPQLKLPEEQYGDDDNFIDDLDESEPSDSENESEYDELPPFKPLTKAQLEKLTKAQKKAYFDEREYREKLFMKKQLKEEKKRRRMMKKMEASLKDLPNEYNNDNTEEEIGGPASVPVPMPDLSLPASFDSDNPTHRYRYLDNSNQWLVRPVLETHGWDHDVGYEGINVEKLFVIKEKIPLSFSGQVTKDKKDANLQMEITSSIKHGQGKSTSLNLDMQTVGKDLAYTLRSETNFSNYKHNKATGGFSLTLLGDVISAGLKLEDKLIINKWFRAVMSGGAMVGRGDVAYGGSLEATFRDKDFPLGRWLTTLGLSVMDWHGDLALGCNVQSQIPVGRSTNVIARANLNNRGSGQVSVRLNSSEQLQIALIGLVPLLRKVFGYPQQMQF